MAATITITMGSITDTQVTINVGALHTGTYYLKAFTGTPYDGGTYIKQAAVTITDGQSVPTTLTNLDPGTTYSFIAEDTSGDEQSYTDFSSVIQATTLDSTPKIATASQWEDLADRVKAKATITVQSYDPGEGSALAENNFIAVYAQ